MDHVVSADGTPIAIERGGRGPHLLVVHGMCSNRMRWSGIRPVLESHFTLTAMDRRGRGESGDGTDYALEREFEDVAAVAAALGGEVIAFGHSFGGLCVLGAALLDSRPFAGLVLYEPGLFEDGDATFEHEIVERLQERIDADDRDGAARYFMTEFVGIPPHEIELVTSSPTWPMRAAAAPTLPREIRAEEVFRLDHARARRLELPVLLPVGGDSSPMLRGPAERLATLLPGARLMELPGQQHLAMDTAPELILDGLRNFASALRL